MRADMAGEAQTLSALGLCAKARGLICGTPLICEALKGANKPFAVFAAADNSPNTEKRLLDRCAYYGVRLCQLRSDGEALAHAVGKRGGKVAAVAVTQEQLCRLAIGKFETEHNL